MDWSIILTLVGSLLGGGSLVGAIMSITLRKANRRKAEAEAALAEAEAESKAHLTEIEVKRQEFESFKDQISELHEMLTFERDRNMELMKINIEKEDRIQDKDRFIGEQTKRLRETQDREFRLRMEHNALQQDFKDEQCRKHGCPYREPENVYSKRAKLQLNIVGVDFKALPPSESATIVDIEFNEIDDDNADDTIED